MPQTQGDKRTFLLLRYVLIIAAAYLFLFEEQVSAPAPIVALIAGALLSNVFLSRLPSDVLLRSITLGIVIAADIAWICLGLWYKGHFGSNILFLYFIILFLAAVGENLILIVSISALLSVADLILFVIPEEGGNSLFNSPSLVRVPFIFIVALFYGYLADNVRQQKKLGEQRVLGLHEIDKAIISTLDLRAVLDVLLEKIALTLPYYSAAAVRLVNPETGLLEPVACRNLDEKEWLAQDWRGGRGIPNAVFESRAPLLVRNVQLDPRIRDPEFYRKNGLISYLGVPLIAKGEALGVLGFYTKEEHRFSDEEISFLTTLAGQAAVAINNSRLYEQTKKQAAELEKANKIKSEFLNLYPGVELCTGFWPKKSACPSPRSGSRTDALVSH